MTTAEPSARRAKKSGACDTRSPASSAQRSQNGWDAMPTTAGSKSSNIKLSRSSHDSNPTWPPVVADHHSPLRCRCPLRDVNRTGRARSSGAAHASANGTLSSAPTSVR